MDHYYVNDNDQPSGEHEVHKNTCIYFSKIVSKTELGYYTNCREAVLKARTFYTNVDGCAYCCPECHTR